MDTVTFELILLEQDLKELLVSLLICCLNPLFELIGIKIVFFGLERCLQGDVKNPVLLITAPSNEIDCLSCLKNLLCQFI